MQPSEQIQKYCSDVCDQIRWKKAKPVIAAEIENHLCDQRDAYISSGYDDMTAAEKAVLQMGDPVSLGQQLDKTHKPSPQKPMIVLTGIFMLAGISANYFIAHSANSLDTFQILPYILAFGLFMICYYLDFTILGKHARKLYYLVFLIAVIQIMTGSSVNGRLYWHMGPVFISSSYLSLIFPVAYALFIYSMRKKGFEGIFKCGIAYLPFAAVLWKIPTMSGLIMYTLTALTVLCFSVFRGWFGVSRKQGLMLVLIPSVTVLTGLTVFAFIAMPQVIERFNTFVNPSQRRWEAGYLYCLIRELISASIFLGRGGVTENMGDITNLPGISTDYSLVYLIHQVGFVVLLCIAVFVILFSFLGIRKALKEKSALGSLLSLSIILTFMLQSFFYIMDNVGYGLVASLSMPFISYGNSSLFIHAALTGFMLSIFRTGEIVRDPSPLASESSRKRGRSIFTYENGRIIINLKG